ncbi:MAG: AbrB/MazE/SpoVT family DNA-binding domain-containing protein [Chloroflexota bacterium]|nr:MAG: AbrB/MazE/SpoVT family DNA-binding domain-containing protein [Chloroflexota bacterium]
MHRSTKTIAVVTKDGRVTLPEVALKQLGVEADTTFTLEVKNGAVVLRPDFEIPPEDAWAYAPGHRASIGRARADLRAGRVHQMSEADLDRLAGD